MLQKLLLASALLLVSMVPSWAYAQAPGDPWAVPENLSRSGVAQNPAFVIDSEGVAHVIWQDDLSNFVHTSFSDNQWSAPTTTNLDRLFRLNLAEQARGDESTIYTGPNPVFVAGPDEFIFAFWITPAGRLLTSSVRNRDFEQESAWRSERTITPQAGSFAVALDARGELHLAYVRTVSEPESPAGIYYTRSKDGGLNWSPPTLLYESPYLRRLAEGEANISLALGGEEDGQRIYVAWANRPRKQVFLAQSADGGDSWEQPKLVAGPLPEAGSASPFNIHVGANKESIVLVWQSGEPGAGCSQIYQSSRDSGATWTEPQLMIEGLAGCAESNAFVTALTDGSEDLLYFLTETKSQIFLSAWDGNRWSQPQEQPTLSGFEEPEIYTGVDYGCHRASLASERLYIVGCDQGGGGDIWVTSLDLRSNASWFSAPVWGRLSPLSEESFKIEAIELVSTKDGFIHAFMTQHLDPAVYYTYWNGQSWSPVYPVLELPEGEAAWPTIAAGPGNELFLIAQSNRGELYLSRALSGNAIVETEWSAPRLLELGHDGQIGSVDLALDPSGTMFAAYSIPVNEGRGIYLAQSADQGTTWSKPLQIFDGEGAGFDLVGAPSLLVSTDGALRVTWTERSIEGDGVPQSLSLYYARSEDGGRTFSDAQLLVEEPVAWRQIVTDGNGNPHLLWQPEDSPATVWDQVSLDGGRTWQHPQGLPGGGGLPAVTRDSLGRLHLVGVGKSILDHWLWDGDRWRSDAPLILPWSSQQDRALELLAAIVNNQGKLMAVLADTTVGDNTAESSLVYSTRTLDLPREQAAVPGVATPTLEAQVLDPATPTPVLVSNPVNTVEGEPNNSGNPVSPFTLALFPVALLLLSVMGIVIWRAGRAKGG
jgi:hypothetical protein